MAPSIRKHLIFLVMTLATACVRTDPPSAHPHETPSKPLAARPQPALTDENPCTEFNRLNTAIRDGKIARTEARARLEALWPQLRAYFYEHGGGDSPREQWVFPLEGYGPKAIGGLRGEGYRAKGYDYFDGNRHGGHPAHDLFIVDKNQDSLDDRSGKPVSVLSMRSGLVVAAAEDWTSGSELRGGKYIYVFDPSTSGLFYYAHQREIFVKPGEVVAAGQKLGLVGRTGKSAAEPRSPTHLHLMWLTISGGVPVPKDLYSKLINR